MLRFIKDIIQSFYTNDKGVSARKMSAFVSVTLCWIITVKHTTDTNIDSVLQVWLLFALLCLGLVTFGQILQFRGGTSTVEKTSIEVTKTEKKDGKDETQGQTNL